MHHTVLIGVVLSGFFGMMGSVQSMSMSDVGMMAGLFVIARLVVCGCFAVMFRCLLMMFRGLLVMLCSLMSHDVVPPFALGENQQLPAVYSCNLRMA